MARWFQLVVLGLLTLGCMGGAGGPAPSDCPTCGPDPEQLSGNFFAEDLLAALDGGAWSGPVPDGELPHFAFDGSGGVEVWEGGEHYTCTLKSSPDGNRWKLTAKCDGKNAGIGNWIRYKGEDSATLQLAGVLSEIERRDATAAEMLEQLLETAGDPVMLTLDVSGVDEMRVTGSRHHTVRREGKDKPNTWSEDLTILATVGTQGDEIVVKHAVKSSLKEPGSENHDLQFSIAADGQVNGVSAKFTAKIFNPDDLKFSTTMLEEDAPIAAQLNGLALTARSLPLEAVGLGDSWKRTTPREIQGKKADIVTTCSLKTLHRDDGVANLDCTVSSEDVVGHHLIAFNIDKGRPTTVSWSEKVSGKDKDDKPDDAKHSGEDTHSWTATSEE